MCETALNIAVFSFRVGEIAVVGARTAGAIVEVAESGLEVYDLALLRLLIEGLRAAF